jgi:hypothetical protein
MEASQLKAHSKWAACETLLQYCGIMAEWSSFFGLLLAPKSLAERKPGYKSPQYQSQMHCVLMALSA